MDGRASRNRRRRPSRVPRGDRARFGFWERRLRPARGRSARDGKKIAAFGATDRRLRADRRTRYTAHSAPQRRFAAARHREIRTHGTRIFPARHDRRLRSRRRLRGARPDRTKDDEPPKPLPPLQKNFPARSDLVAARTQRQAGAGEPRRQPEDRRRAARLGLRRLQFVVGGDVSGQGSASCRSANMR